MRDVGGCRAVSGCCRRVERVPAGKGRRHSVSGYLRVYSMRAMTGNVLRVANVLA